jgi:glycosyltransferase involved in cell wall biosynthesis
MIAALHGQPNVTLLVCTYNRCDDLREMLESALAQTASDFTYEVLVVDNNSSDETRKVVESIVARGHPNIRYTFERKQGKSFALNRGITEARGEICSVVDDDQVLPTDWLSTVVAQFRANPNASFVGGRVLPLWLGDVPPWLTEQHWSAVGIVDYGDREMWLDARHPICLLACSFRRGAIESAGGYRADLGVSRQLIGSVEDFEILQRLSRAGLRGLYTPALSLLHKVPPSRLTKQYHRRWHTEHGRFYALFRDDDFEGSRWRILEVPGHVYRRAGQAALRWLSNIVRGRKGEAFGHETALRFYWGFFLERRRSRREALRHNLAVGLT